jgi:hypothetical protein
VTGVSTGALIAPFAFIGDESAYDEILSLYRNPQSDWAELKDWFVFLPWRESFVSTEGLRRDVEKHLSKERIAQIASGSRDDRTMIIGTTNLDIGVNRPFDFGAMCEAAEVTGNYKGLYDVLMASSAIPAVFPPQVIEGSLYVDGGTTGNLLIGANMRSERAMLPAWRRAYPDKEPLRIRFWVIINNQIADVPTIVAPTWPAITAESVSTMTRFATVANLRLLQYQCEIMSRLEHYEVEFRYVSIPYEWRPPVKGSFKKETMNDLADLGEKMGSDPGSWKERVPD